MESGNKLVVIVTCKKTIRKEHLSISPQDLFFNRNSHSNHQGHPDTRGDNKILVQGVARVKITDIK